MIVKVKESKGAEQLIIIWKNDFFSKNIYIQQIQFVVMDGTNNISEEKTGLFRPFNSTFCFQIKFSNLSYYTRTFLVGSH